MRIDTLMLSLFLLALGTIGCSQPDTVTAEYEPAECDCAEESGAEAPPPARSNGLADEDSPVPVAVATTGGEAPDQPAELKADDTPQPEAFEPAEPAEGTATPPKNADEKDEKDAADGPKGVINLNTASMEQLMVLPGVGPALAARIVEFRQKRSFDTTRHLLRVKGIGESTFAKLQPMLAVSGETTLAK